MTYNKGRPQNYADVNDGSLEQKTVKGVLRTRCECGHYVQAFRIVDTRGLPEEVTKGQKWACDPCWTSWIRHDPQRQREYQGRPFRLLDWIELHGAPADVVARFIASDRIAYARLLQARPSEPGRERDRIDEIIFRRVDVERLG